MSIWSVHNAKITTVLLAGVLTFISLPVQAGTFVEWEADPSHPVVAQRGSPSLAIGHDAGRSDLGNSATWVFSGDSPILIEGVSGKQAALYGFLEQTHTLGPENFLVAALDAYGNIKIHSRSAASGETVNMRGAIGFQGNDINRSELAVSSLRLSANVISNAKGSSVFYRTIIKSGGKWFLSELNFPGTTGEIEFEFSMTQWAEWDPFSAPAVPLPSAFSVPSASVGKPDFLGLFFDGSFSGSGMGIMIARIAVSGPP